MTDTEHVLVIPAAVLEQLGPFSGFTDRIDHYLPAILGSNELMFAPRPAMENDLSYKQLIPYVLLRHRDRYGKTSCFRYTRGSGGGESRLHARQSLGIGGHINPVDDKDGSDRYTAGMRRELDEEVAIDTNYSQSAVGLIHDDATEVGRVHLGVVHVFDLDQPHVTAREADLADGGFVDVETLQTEADRLETWSQLCLRHVL